MKPTPKPYDCTLFTISESLLHQAATDQNKQDYYKYCAATDDGAHLYLVKQIDTVLGEAFGVTLLCAEAALRSQIRIWVPVTSFIEEEEGDREVSTALFSRLDDAQKEAQKIEVLLHYPTDEHHSCLGSLYVNNQKVGDMLLEEG